MRKPTIAAAACVFGIALVLRLAVLTLTFPGNDAVYYYDDAQIALNLLDGKGYSLFYHYRNWLFYEAVLKTAQLQDPITTGTKTTAVKQPAYPLFLAGLFYCFGAKNFLVVLLVNAILSSLTVSLLFLCFKPAAPRTGFAVALAAAFYPPFLFHSVTVPESTTLLLSLIAGLWLWLVKVRDGASFPVWLLGGAIAGLAILTDPVTLPVVILCFCYAAWLDRRDPRRRLAASAAAVAVVLLILSPWLVRNFVVFKRFPVFKTGVGLVFNWGLHFSGKGSWISEDRMVALEKAGRDLSELEEDEAMRRELRSAFPAHWREYVAYDIPHHFLHLWWDVPRYWNNYSVRYLLGRRIPYLLLVALALPQLLPTTARLLRDTRVALRNEVPKISALTVIMTTTVVYSLFGAFHSRYRFPIELGLLVLAGYTLRPVVDAIRNRWVARPSTGREASPQVASPFAAVRFRAAVARHCERVATATAVI